jgi:cob(I)alamin adenosyltransferase
VRIYTRRGDEGETDLVGSGRIAKDHQRVDAYGAVDELCAALGVAATHTEHADLRTLVETIQRELFVLGAYLATPEARHREAGGTRSPGPEEVAALEAQIDAFERELEPLRRFVLPGGTQGAAAFHHARTVGRRAERALVTLHRSEPLDPGALRFLNRLSDLLFVMARVDNRRSGVPDVEWEGRRP